MGSLTSGPSAPPPQPQVVFVPQPTPAPAVTEPQADAEVTESTEEQTAEQARRQGLLERDRGRFGTIQTGFRGLLGLIDNAPQRKTLLGE